MTARLARLALFGLALTASAPAAAVQEPREQEPELPPGTDEAGPAASAAVVGPTPGAPTISLAAAVSTALRQAFALLDSRDAVSASRWREKTAFADFLPSLTPSWLRGEGRDVFGLDLQQRLPWSGAALTAAGRYVSEPDNGAPFPGTSDLRLTLSQPLLRGFGPNAAYFELRNARRAVEGQERSYQLARERGAVDVASAFYAVIAQRQLTDVARQSLDRSERLLKSSSARLEVGLASKLDVFRAELQAAQARDALVRSEASLQTALERFRGLLALPPGDPVEPEAAELPWPEGGFEPVEVLVRRALDSRLELAEARELVDDARRAASLAKQNLLPQLDLNLGVTRLGYGSSLGNAWRASDTQVNVFLSTSYPVPQATARATSAVAQLGLEQRQRSVREREFAVEQEVRQALRDLEQIRQSVLLQQKAVDVAEQQRRLAVLRYERGLGSNFDVVDAESSLVTARSALVQLLASYAVARLDLKRSTGTLDLLADFP